MVGRELPGTSTLVALVACGAVRALRTSDAQCAVGTWLRTGTAVDVAEAIDSSEASRTRQARDATIVWRAAVSTLKALAIDTCGATWTVDAFGPICVRVLARRTLGARTTFGRLGCTTLETSHIVHTAGR